MTETQGAKKSGENIQSRASTIISCLPHVIGMLKGEEKEWGRRNG
jgi:hypothetical protein